MPLNEYDPTEIVGVTRQHIQEAMAALNWAYNLCSSMDMTDRARQGTAGIKASSITILIERAFNHLEGYITEPEIDTDVRVQTT